MISFGLPFAHRDELQQSVVSYIFRSLKVQRLLKNLYHPDSQKDTFDPLSTPGLSMIHLINRPSETQNIKN